MRALVYSAPNQLDLQELPCPMPGAGEVLVSVETAGICGSGISRFLGHRSRCQPALGVDQSMIQPAVCGSVHAPPTPDLL